MAVESGPDVAAGQGSRLGRGEWISLASMSAFILALHVIGWGSLLGLIAPQRLALGDGAVFTVGLGVTAYVLGMRHAFDADHIAAIDNTTRKLMQDGGRPVSVGFWFSLGHSSVVFGLCLLLSLGVRALAGQVGDDSSALQEITGTIGLIVSTTFLFVIGLINLAVLVGIVKVFAGMRTGDLDEVALEQHLNNRGFLYRLLSRVTRAIRKPWHMYPTGLLFGLGFDTATEVSLLVLAGGAAAFALPWYAILTLPILFAAGMSLLDTIDGCFMNFAYGWAFSNPTRKVYYNIAITGLSVAVALVIAIVQSISLLAGQLHITSGPLAAIAELDLNIVGFVVAGLFVVAWALAIGIWHFGRIEQRWAAGRLSRTTIGQIPSGASTDARNGGRWPQSW